jgi:hypothetical protein
MQRSTAWLHDVYDVSIGPRHPLVRFAGAAVRMGVRRGARVLVIVTPVPYTRLAGYDDANRARFTDRVAVIREAVERNGGTVLDLHEALPGDELRDMGGHFNAKGARHMEALVWPVLASMLWPPDAGSDLP